MDAAASENPAPGDRGMSFLLDTDICSAEIKGDARVSNRFISTAAGYRSRP
jgi:hypothetical protein